MKRRLIATLLAAVLVCGSGITVWADEGEDAAEIAAEDAAGEEINALENSGIQETENADADEQADTGEAVEQAESSEEPVALSEVKEVDMNGLEWKEADGVLTISGNGEIEEYHWIKIKEEEITSVVIEEGVTGIGDKAFKGYEKLEQISIPNSVTKIGEQAFYKCRSLSQISIPDSERERGNLAFVGSGLTSVVIPGGVVEIQIAAFANCESLTEVFISDGVTKIGEDTFAECSLPPVL